MNNKNKSDIKIIHIPLPKEWHMRLMQQTKGKGKLMGATVTSLIKQFIMEEEKKDNLYKE